MKIKVTIGIAMILVVIFIIQSFSSTKLNIGSSESLLTKFTYDLNFKIGEEYVYVMVKDSCTSKINKFVMNKNVSADKNPTISVPKNSTIYISLYSNATILADWKLSNESNLKNLNYKNSFFTSPKYSNLNSKAEGSSPRRNNFEFEITNVGEETLSFEYIATETKEVYNTLNLNIKSE